MNSMLPDAFATGSAVCCLSLIILVVLVIVVIVLILKWIFSSRQTVVVQKENPPVNERYCTDCGRSIPMDAKLCPYCGKKF